MIAVTGAAGFIGSNLVHRLASLGHRLLLVDQHALTAAKVANWAGLPAHHFMDHHLFVDQLDALNPDAIFHLGACSATTETDWNYLTENNIRYSQRLWQWCTRKQKPYLYASSAATYGDGSRGFDDRTPPRELQPLNLYGKSKNDFDIWVMSQVEAGEPTPPRWAGLKFFNVYGPRELHKERMASVVYHTWKQIKATGGMRLFRSNDPQYPDGGQLRDFVFVHDCIDHMLWLWQQAAINGIFNSGTGQARTFYDLAAAVFRSLKLPSKIDYIEMPADLHGKYQNYTQAAMTKIREAGFRQPATTLERGVEQTVAWLESQS